MMLIQVAIRRAVDLGVCAQQRVAEAREASCIQLAQRMQCTCTEPHSTDKSISCSFDSVAMPPHGMANHSKWPKGMHSAGARLHAPNPITLQTLKP